MEKKGRRHGGTRLASEEEAVKILAERSISKSAGRGAADEISSRSV
jgi:hypothetical protein